MKNKKAWEYMKEDGVKCTSCWFHEQAKCVKDHNFTDHNAPNAKELCKHYVHPYEHMMKINMELNKQ